MAEFLVIAKQNSNATELNQQVGDIVVVRESGSNWAKMECLGTFLVVDIDTISVEEAIKYVGPLMGEPEQVLDEYDDPVLDLDGNPVLERKVLKTSKYYIDLSSVDIEYISTQNWYVPSLTEQEIKER